MDAVHHQGLAQPGTLTSPELKETVPGRRIWADRNVDALRPNLAVRWAFYLSIVAIPFLSLYIPGTGERFGVARITQGLLLLAMFSRPKVCFRLVPICLLWMLAYCGVRIVWGMWLAPEYSRLWWPSTLDLLQY